MKVGKGPFGHGVGLPALQSNITPEILMPYSLHWIDRLGDSQSSIDIPLDYAFLRAVRLQKEFAFRAHLPATILDADSAVVAELDAARTMLNVRHPKHGAAHHAFYEAADQVDR